MKVINIAGPDGNAFALMGYAKAFSKEMELEFEPIMKDMTSSDYNHLLDVFNKNFNSVATLVK